MPEVTKPRVFIEQGDELKPVELPVELAQRAAIYRELRALNLSLDEIKFLWREIV